MTTIVRPNFDEDLVRKVEALTLKVDQQGNANQQLVQRISELEKIADINAATVEVINTTTNIHNSCLRDIIEQLAALKNVDSPFIRDAID